VKYSVKEFPPLDEKVYIYRHPSGLDVFFIPKKGYFEKYAMFSVNYGSIDCTFIDKNGQRVEVPAGIAHFLEHKLFEQKDGSVMDKFAALGSSPNAFTSFTQTSYLFSCTDLFQENFRLLLDFVQNPYITEESVEKEKGIIGQEINMYQDNPHWVTMMNFLGSMYHKNHVRLDIAGTLESISQINPELLYLCYNSYYKPDNMCIAVAGDLDADEVFRLVDEGISEAWVNRDDKRAMTVFDEEPAEVLEKIKRQKMDISMPMFLAGYKDVFTDLSPEEIAARKIAMRILLEILFGRSSDFFEKYYSEGIINDSFYSNYECERGFAFSSFGGESEKPEEVLAAIRKSIENARKNGVDEKAFKRILNNFCGAFIKRFNSMESICRQYTAARFLGIDVFDYYALYDKISVDDVNGLLMEHFNEDRMAVAITEPFRQ